MKASLAFTDSLAKLNAALDENLEPYQPINGTGHYKRKKPITVYKDEQTAVGISPINASSEVLMYFRNNK